MARLKSGFTQATRHGFEKISLVRLNMQLAFGYRFSGLQAIDSLLLRCNSAHVGHILARFGASLGESHDLNSPLVIHNANQDYSNLTIGRQCHLGKEVFLDLRDRIWIGDYVTISMRAMILTHTDVGRSPLSEARMLKQKGPVVIKQGTYIGAGAILLQGVTLGECAIVGAGAVVTSDIADHEVAVGVPARTRKNRSSGRAVSTQEPF